MQVYANSNRVSLKTILIFIIVVFVAFLPIDTFLFSLKNDAFTGYFPPKFFMSESLHAGYLPLWNPYINFGFPQYGDMSGAYWSPVTWLIAVTVGYNAYTFTLELLFYILIAGIGMYLLTGLWKIDKRVRTMAAIAFMCSGYTIGHLQHFNWVSGAAFLPWCFWSYLLLLKNATLKHTILAVLLFYMLAATAHPGIIISATYFFLALSLYYLIKNEDELSIKLRLRKWGLSHSIFLMLLLILSAGMIVGYLDIFPFFVRAEKISMADSLSNPTNLKSWISALLPLAIVKNDGFYNTDISMRNCYFTLTFLIFFLLACFNKKNSWQKFLLITGAGFALLSAGGIFKMAAYKVIPFIGYVRLNGEFRIFSLMCFIIIAAMELDKFIKQKSIFGGSIKWIYYFIEIIIITCIVIGLYKTITERQGFLFESGKILSRKGLPLKLKTLIDALSFYDGLWLQGSIQLFILWGIKWCIKFGNWDILQKIIVVDMVIACLLNIPFTGVGKASVAEVQRVLNKSPKGIPIPTLKAINNIATIPSTDQELVGNWSMYNKQIGVKTAVAYPIILKNMNAYFLNSELNPKDNYLNKPFIFLKDSSNKINVAIHSFSPNNLNIIALSGTATIVVLQQNFYPHWFYSNGVNKMPVNKEAINFMSAPIVKGQNKITFSFEPKYIQYAMAISVFTFAIYCFLFLIFCLKKEQPTHDTINNTN